MNESAIEELDDAVLKNLARYEFLLDSEITKSESDTYQASLRKLKECRLLLSRVRSMYLQLDMELSESAPLAEKIEHFSTEIERGIRQVNIRLLKILKTPETPPSSK